MEKENEGMRLTSNHPALLSPRAFGPTHASTAATQRETQLSRPVLRDSFELAGNSPVQLTGLGAENFTGATAPSSSNGAAERRGNFFQRLGGAIRNTVDDMGDAIRDTADGLAHLPERIVGLAKGIGRVFGLGEQPDRQFDGMLVGSGDDTFRPGTPLDQIPAVTPTNRHEISPRGNRHDDAGKTVLYVNGIVTDLEGQGREMQDIANATGMNVIGIHNSTEGAGADLAQSVDDKLAMVRDLASDLTGKPAKGSNPAVDTLADTMYTELMAGRDVNVMGYSQGALITARALRDLASRLRIENGLPPEQVEQLMSRINVETFGGAGAIFPDGPNYVHYVNTKDVVPVAFGLGNALSYPGRGAVVHEFSEGKSSQFATAHDLDDSYLPHRLPFDRARNGGFVRPSSPRSPR